MESVWLIHQIQDRYNSFFLYLYKISLSGSKRELFYSIRFNVDVPSSIHVQDVQKLLEEVGGVLANSTRDLIGLLSGESAAKFLADLAPFNIKYVYYNGLSLATIK